MLWGYTQQWWAAGSRLLEVINSFKVLYSGQTVVSGHGGGVSLTPHSLQRWLQSLRLTKVISWIKNGFQWMQHNKPGMQLPSLIFFETSLPSAITSDHQGSFQPFRLHQSVHRPSSLLLLKKMGWVFYHIPSFPDKQCHFPMKCRSILVASLLPPLTPQSQEITISHPSSHAHVVVPSSNFTKF